MGTFIYTDSGFLSVDRIEPAIHSKDGRYEIIVDGRTFLARDAEFERKIVSIVPVGTERWECLTRLLDDGLAPAIWSEPVIAWGLTMLGDTIPITPVDTDGVAEGTFALRKIGEGRVHVPGDGTYASAEEWFARNERDAAAA
jgi:hypothetical protein